MRSLILLALVVTSCLALPAQNVTRVVKQTNKKIYIHWMPWFETKETSGNNQWGIHWTMANKNPDNIIGENNKREIAAHYYPEVGPYGSGDSATIDYQIQMMKLSGADGVLIDWPGTIQANDFPKNHQNCLNFIQKLTGSGLEFGIVYEDRNLEFAGDKLAQGRADMTYLRDNFFNQPNYIKHNGAPLLLVFGPIQLQQESQWDDLFSVLSQKPTFLPLWYESQDAGKNAAGEYAWIYSDFMDGLNNFYTNRPLGTKMGVVYPGFHDFYQEGGWGNSYFNIPHDGTNSFRRTLESALNSDVPFIQAATWNDYGEGTMIEPTREFGNQFLNILAGAFKLPYGDREFNLVRDLYLKRKEFKGKTEILAKLDEVNDALNHLQHDRAEQILRSL